MASKMDPKMMAMMAAKKRGAMAPRGGMAAAAPAPGGMMGMKKGGMASGGMPMKDGKPAFIGDGKGEMKKGGATKKMMGGGMAYAKGGGIESKGKTKGTMIKMKSGGKMC